MGLKVEDLDDHSKYRQLLAISYSELIPFILDYLRRRSLMTIFFWSACALFLLISINLRINIAGYFPERSILLHTMLGLVIFPLLFIPIHESLHVIPLFLAGARRIRVGMDLKQYLFYVTAHRYVATSTQFRIVAIIPFLITSIGLSLLIFLLPGLWKWSLSLFLFVHATMCAGDFALLNYFHINRHKKIYTWDDADQKMAYFYEEF
jgi:hypothetical protein